MKLKYTISALCMVFAFAKANAQLDDAQFNVVFESTWSQSTHPHSSGSLPGNAHWSRLVGTVHNSDADFIEAGETATTGIENVAELGNNNVFFSEINTEISNGNAQEILDFGALSSSAGTITGSFTVSEDYPLLTLVSMIAPSPDWLIMLDSVSLLNDDGTAWKETITFDVYPYDAGTDSGSDYTSSNADTSPADPITNSQGTAPFSSEKMGTMTITLDSQLSIADSQEDIFSLFASNTLRQFVVTNTSNDAASFNLFDITGKKVQYKVLEAGKNNISYGSISSGVYIAQITSVNGGTFTQKTIIQ